MKNPESEAFGNAGEHFNDTKMPEENMEEDTGGDTPEEVMVIAMAVEELLKIGDEEGIDMINELIAERIKMASGGGEEMEEEMPEGEMPEEEEPVG